MNFIVFVILFTVVCGWLDAKIPNYEQKEVE
jgi:hypothetical protein